MSNEVEREEVKENKREIKKEYTQVFSENLKRAMKSKGYSNSMLAAACNTSRSAVSQWLNGTRLPRLDNIDKIADIL